MSDHDKIEVINVTAGDRLMAVERLIVCALLGLGSAQLFAHGAVGIGVCVFLFFTIHLVTRTNIGQRLWHAASTILWGLAGFSLARMAEASTPTIVVATLIPAGIAFASHLAWRRVSDRIRMIG